MWLVVQQFIASASSILLRLLVEASGNHFLLNKYPNIYTPDLQEHALKSNYVIIIAPGLSCTNTAYRKIYNIPHTHKSNHLKMIIYWIIWINSLVKIIAQITSILMCHKLENLKIPNPSHEPHFFTRRNIMFLIHTCISYIIIRNIP